MPRSTRDASAPPEPPAPSVAQTPPKPDLAALIARVRSAAERQVAEVATLMQGADVAESDADRGERAARRLATLVKTLRELALLEAVKEPVGEEVEAAAGGEIRDLEEFRRELSRRLAELRSPGAAS